MKIKSKKVISEIIRKVLNESPMMYDPHQSTIQSRMYKNQLKQGEHILKYPSQREIDHEMMRLNTLFVPRPAQYKLRLTKITNPQKMYDAYVSILSWKKKNPQYDDLLDDILDNVRYYLRKNGYGDMLAGRGGRAVHVENRKINEEFDREFNKNQFDLVKKKIIRIETKESERWKQNINSMYIGSAGINSMKSYLKLLNNCRDINTLIKVWSAFHIAMDDTENSTEDDFWEILKNN